MAILYKADGTRVDGIKAAGKDGEFTLEQLQQAVGGYIEPVPGTACRAWCNEEGIRLDLPINADASRLFGMPLRGDVLVMQDGDKQS